MSRALSVDSVIDKNKITSDVAWVILLDIAVTDPTTREVTETLHIARNDEPVIFNGVSYQPANFEIDIDQRQNQAPSVTLNAHDETRYIAQRMEEMAGGVMSTVTMTVVNSARLSQPAEWQSSFQVVTASVKNFVVSFQLGAENPLAIQFPKHIQRQDQCAWRYKGYGCGYAGALPRCDYSRDGPMGCAAHDNLANFRALTGLVRMNI